MGESLDDKKFISQTVNYANNEGVLWCVLTNGKSYRVYKTNEPVSMEQKLLFEISLDEAKAGRAAEVVNSLRRISPPAVSSGELDSWGEQLFADARVRDVLDALGTDPPKRLLELVEAKLGQPKLQHDILRASLGRVLSGSHSAIKGPKAGGKPVHRARPLPRNPVSSNTLWTTIRPVSRP